MITPRFFSGCLLADPTFRMEKKEIEKGWSSEMVKIVAYLTVFTVSDSQKALDDVLLEERPIATLTILCLGSKTVGSGATSQVAVA